MKKLLLLLLILAIPTIVPSVLFAETAVVNFEFTDFSNFKVAVWVSDKPNIAEATQLTGQFDTDEDGTVEVGNIVTGKTYYFRARAYNKVTGKATSWSNEMSFDVPTVALPDPQLLPDIPVINIPGFVLESITLKPIPGVE